MGWSQGEKKKGRSGVVKVSSYSLRLEEKKNIKALLFSSSSTRREIRSSEKRGGPGKQEKALRKDDTVLIVFKNWKTGGESKVSKGEDRSLVFRYQRGGIGSWRGRSQKKRV